MSRHVSVATRRIGFLATLTLVLAFGYAGTSGATQVAFGTFAFSNFGTGAVTFTNTPAGNMLGANTTQIVLPGQIITSLTPTLLGDPNSFCNAVDCGGINGPDPAGRLAVGQSLLFLSGTNTIDIAGGLASAIRFQFSSGTTPIDRYEFDSLGPGQASTFNALGSSFLVISYFGNFTDSALFFDSQEAAVSFAFTQASAGASVGESGSFSTPAVPEPASMALTGGGVVLIGLVARARNKA